MSYEGSCHCGAVTFEVAGEAPAKAITCNCSHCRRKGLLLTFVPIDALTVRQGEASLTEYRFNREQIGHVFCKVCGCQPFARGEDREGKHLAAINLRCVPDIDLDALELQHVDGASL